MAQSTIPFYTINSLSNINDMDESTMQRIINIVEPVEETTYRVYLHYSFGYGYRGMDPVYLLLQLASDNTFKFFTWKEGKLDFIYPSLTLGTYTETDNEIKLKIEKYTTGYETYPDVESEDRYYSFNMNYIIVETKKILEIFHNEMNESTMEYMAVDGEKYTILHKHKNSILYENFGDKDYVLNEARDNYVEKPSY